ncbi:hypothetical protein F7P10_30965 [Actinomadura sp. WMMB 499]|nr:hypothetical protein F7P10_30965 [Actinomadura sp. WMMB 499]
MRVREPPDLAFGLGRLDVVGDLRKQRVHGDGREFGRVVPVVRLLVDPLVLEVAVADGLVQLGGRDCRRGGPGRGGRGGRAGGEGAGRVEFAAGRIGRPASGERACGDRREYGGRGTDPPGRGTYQPGAHRHPCSCPAAWRSTAKAYRCHR